MNTPDPEDPRLTPAWKEKFRLLQQIGADRKFIHVLNDREFFSVSYRDRARIYFNFPAFLFGPLYYFSKGMWDKGLALASLALISGLNPALWIMVSCLEASIANYDYYRFIVFREKIWPDMPPRLIILMYMLGVVGVFTYIVQILWVITHPVAFVSLSLSDFLPF